jgi:membrane protease YdiL (CAAX protease family)
MILSMISMWVSKRLYIWGALLVLSYLCAWWAGIVTVLGLIPIVVLFVCHYGISLNLSGWSRYFLVMVAGVVSFGLNWHLIKGFSNPCVVEGFLFSNDASRFNWCLNFDKPFMGIFALGLYLPLINNQKQFWNLLFLTMGWTLVAGFALLGWGVYRNIITWDIKWFTFIPLFLFFNLFLVIIPEEAFYRGFLQREITLNLKNRASGILAILVASLLFAISHLFSTPSIEFFIALMLTGIAYGGIYLLTGAIETSILTHFFINTIHIIFFTYPTLRS